MALSDRCFMIDRTVLASIVAAADLAPGDVVFEIGAGHGNLTELLAKKTKLTAIEKEADLFGVLSKKLSDNPTVDLILGDALKVEFPIYNKIVSNVPYSISRKLIERIVTEGFETATLVIQKEFGQKLMANPGDPDYRMLSVLAQTTCVIEHITDIPPQAFKPQPRVESSLIRLIQSWKPPRDYVTFLNRLFSSKNKRIGKVIEAPAHLASQRPASMTTESFRDLYLGV